jgi:hypothetical protein
MVSFAAASDADKAEAPAEISGEEVWGSNSLGLCFSTIFFSISKKELLKILSG